MSPNAILDWALLAAQIMLALALLITSIRIILGPTLADRVVGLDMLVGIAIGLIAVIALRSQFAHALDIAMALSVAGFLATLAFARYILTRGKEPANPAKSAEAAKPARAKRRTRS